MRKPLTRGKGVKAIKITKTLIGTTIIVYMVLKLLGRISLISKAK